MMKFLFYTIEWNTFWEWSESAFEKTNKKYEIGLFNNITLLAFFEDINFLSNIINCEAANSNLDKKPYLKFNEEAVEKLLKNAYLTNTVENWNINLLTTTFNQILTTKQQLIDQYESKGHVISPQALQFISDYNGKITRLFHQAAIPFYSKNIDLYSHVVNITHHIHTNIGMPEPNKPEISTGISLNIKPFEGWSDKELILWEYADMLCEDIHLMNLLIKNKENIDYLNWKINMWDILNHYLDLILKVKQINSQIPWKYQATLDEKNLSNELKELIINPKKFAYKAS